MSEAGTSEVIQRNPSTSKNIKKLRTLSMVRSLTQGWHQWVSENQEKQAKEPAGWSPSYATEPGEGTRELGTWTVPSKRKLQAATNAVPVMSSQMPHVNPQPGAEKKGLAPESPVESRIRTKQVVKTVTSGAQERSVGVGLLAERICKENALSGEEVDRILNEKGSPTRRRKCSNLVSELTRSWKEVEGSKAKEEGEPSGEVTEDLELILEEAQVGNTRNQRNYVSGEEEWRDGVKDTSVKIRRSSVPVVKKDKDDANKLNVLSKKYSAVGTLKGRWQNWAKEHTTTQKLNPFSEDFDYDYSMSTRLRKGEEGYGRPKEGTKTAERARRAEAHIHREIDDMCYIIRTMADPDPDGRKRVTFGALFNRYVRISDKVVGILMRARKHGKVAFEGEMLWQGQDDDVVITLLV